MKKNIKLFINQILRGLVMGISIFLGLSIGFVGLYAFNWSGVGKANPGQKLTSSMWNSSMNTITGSIQALQDNMVDLSSNQIIAGIKTFSNYVSGITPTALNHFTTKQYVDSKVSTIICPSCPSCNCNRGGWQTRQVWTSCNSFYNGVNCKPPTPTCPSGWTTLSSNLGYRSGGFTHITGTTYGILNSSVNCARYVNY